MPRHDHGAKRGGAPGNLVHQAILHGHSALFTTAADLLFQIVTRRYEQKSIVLTTNLAFREWHTIFPNASCAVGLIDRLTHHAAIVKIAGDSHRLREAEQTQKRRRASVRLQPSAVSGGRGPRMGAEGASQFELPSSISRDGQFLLYTGVDGGASREDVWVYPLTATRRLTR